jgi:hypothetical protein
VEAEPSERGWALPVPSYESSFRVFSNHVVLDRRFTGDAAADSAELLTAIRRGRMFTVIDGLAGPGAFEFTGTGTGEVATMGDDLPLIGSAQLRAQVAGPSGASLVLLRNGEVVKQETGTELVANVSEVGAYRVEVTIPGARLPWLFSNPIYLGFDRRPPSPRPSPPPSLTAVSLAETNGESSPGSINEFTASSDIAWHYRLGDGVAAGQYAAIRVPVRGLEAFTSVRFDVSSERPMRLWVQLRKPDGSGERWGRSVYSEQVGRTAAVSFDRLKPIGPTATERAALASVDSLLFVVDTVNTRPGSEGRVKLSNVALAR